MYHASGIKNLKGFTLIEALALLFIFSVVVMAFFETYAVGTRMILESKRRLGATALANQKMEIVRSLDYDNIGTTTGVPTGDIPEYENVSVNGMQYTVHTFVQYADDIFDGKAGSNPNDAIPNDYKRVRIKVYWGDEGSDQTVYVFANISPNGVETSAGGGVLSINILDSTGMGVSGATVHIENDDTGTDITTDTDATGNITLPGTPEGTQNYELTVSKGGYYGVVTYPPAPPNAFVPMDEHASVVDDAVNQKSIVMDQYADITIHSKDPFGTDILNFDFHMKGGKIFGATTADPPVTMYGYDQDLITNASGIKDVQDQSHGQYTLSETDARYQLYKLNPGGATNDIFDALPGQTNTVDMILLDTQIGSLKVIVTNATDDSPIAGATAHLTNAGLGYDATVDETDQYGFAYFPIVSSGLVAGTYDLEVSAAGFTSDNSTVDVNGGLVTKAVGLNP